DSNGPARRSGKNSVIDDRLDVRRVAAIVAAYSILEEFLSGGGEGGIRTPDTVARMPHFECGAFNHSATSPWPQGARQPLFIERAAGRKGRSGQATWNAGRRKTAAAATNTAGAYTLHDACGLVRRSASGRTTISRGSRSGNSDRIWTQRPLRAPSR